MPKNSTLFTAYPESSSQIRGQGKIAASSPLFAIKKFSIHKEGAVWKASSHRQNVVGYFTLKLPKAILAGKRHYVYRFDVNEEQESAECHQIAVFTELPWAMEYMNTGEVACASECFHNQECRQLRPKIVDPSQHWEVGYFVISNKKLIVCEHAYRYAEPPTQ